MRVLWIILALGAAVAVGVLVFRPRGRAQAPKPTDGPTVLPYREIRRQVIGKVADPSAPRPAPPARPVGLDCRLPATEAEKIRRHGVPSEANWKAVHPCYVAARNSVWDELRAIDPEIDFFELLSPGRRALILVGNLEREVYNGGFDQFYLNSSGAGAALTPEALRLLGYPKAAAIVERANSQFGSEGPQKSRGARLAQMQKLPDTVRDVWHALNSEYYNLEDLPFGGLGAGAGVRYILDHEAEFYKPQ